MKYVNAVLFSEGLEEVVLVRRQAPAFLAGKLCTPSGQVQVAETGAQAIARTVLSQTGLDVPASVFRPLMLTHTVDKGAMMGTFMATGLDVSKTVSTLPSHAVVVMKTADVVGLCVTDPLAVPDDLLVTIAAAQRMHALPNEPISVVDNRFDPKDRQDQDEKARSLFYEAQGSLSPGDPGRSPTQLASDVLYYLAQNNAPGVRRALEQGAKAGMKDTTHPKAWQWIRSVPTGASLMHDAVSVSGRSVGVADAMAVIDALLEAGAPFDEADNEGYTPLHNAAAVNHVAALTRLLTKGARLDAQSVKGYTPLHVAMHNRSSDAVSLLIRMGSNTQLKTHRGENAMDYAHKLENAEAQAMLRSSELKQTASQVLKTIQDKGMEGASAAVGWFKRK